MVNADGIGQPANAPGQEARILDWLFNEGGLTQLQALQHLAVARLAAMVYRLKGRGHSIRTELVEVPTRYGPAKVACYHLVHLAPLADYVPPDSWPMRREYLHPIDKGEQQPDLFNLPPPFQCACCCDTGKLRHAAGTYPCPAVGCQARGAAERRGEFCSPARPA
jgi:hypothetical protein